MAKKKTGGKKGKKQEEKEENTREAPGAGELGGLFTFFDPFYKELSSAPQEFLNHVTNPEVISHLIRAGLEGYQAFSGAVPALNLPEETKLHLHLAERELLLAIRAVMDARLTDLDKKIGELDRCEPGKGAKDLKKIDVKD